MHCYVFYKEMLWCWKIMYYTKCSKFYFGKCVGAGNFVLVCFALYCNSFVGNGDCAVHELYCTFLRLELVLGIVLW